jgi:hypothetical protein
VTRYFVSGARTASTGPGLGFSALTGPGTHAHAVVGGTQNTFEILAVALWAFEFNFFVLVHEEQLDKFLTFYALEFIYWHLDTPCRSLSIESVLFF